MQSASGSLGSSSSAWRHLLQAGELATRNCCPYSQSIIYNHVRGSSARAIRLRHQECHSGVRFLPSPNILRTGGWSETDTGGGCSIRKRLSTLVDARRFLVGGENAFIQRNHAAMGLRVYFLQRCLSHWVIGVQNKREIISLLFHATFDLPCHFGGHKFSKNHPLPAKEQPERSRPLLHGPRQGPIPLLSSNVSLEFLVYFILRAVLLILSPVLPVRVDQYPAEFVC